MNGQILCGGRGEALEPELRIKPSRGGGVINYNETKSDAQLNKCSRKEGFGRVHFVDVQFNAGNWLPHYSLHLSECWTHHVFSPDPDHWNNLHHFLDYDCGRQQELRLRQSPCPDQGLLGEDAAESGPGVGFPNHSPGDFLLYFLQ